MTKENIILIATDSTFDKMLENEPRRVLAWFSAAWCGPCKRMEPILRVVATELASKVKVLHIDVEASPKITEKHQIKALPSFVLFDQAAIVDRRSAVMTSAQLKEFIEQSV